MSNKKNKKNKNNSSVPLLFINIKILVVININNKSKITADILDLYLRVTIDKDKYTNRNINDDNLAELIAPKVKNTDITKKQFVALFKTSIAFSLLLIFLKALIAM